MTRRSRPVRSASVPLDVAEIRRLRLAAGLTLAEAAARAGMAGHQAWEVIESGRRANVTVATLERVAGVLGVPAGTLLTA